MRPLHRTTFWTRLQNTLPTPATPAVAVLSATPASTLLAQLLPAHVPILTSPNHKLPSLPNPIHTLSHTEHDLRPAASWAIQNSITHLLLPTTRLEHALTTLTTNSPDPNNPGPANGLELLPSGTITLHHPLINVHENVLDATATTLLTSPHPSFERLAKEALGEIPVSAILRHTTHKYDTLQALDTDTTNLLQDSIVEASHWGYVVARRSTLATVFHDRRAKLCALHALTRIIQHVSGSETRLSLDDEQISRMATDLLTLDNGKLSPLPKGRTAAGVVVRPATGRFARRLLRNSSNHLLRHSSDDLMIFSREPDHENSALLSIRLRGNHACAPLPNDGAYWDNRFVLLAGGVGELSEQYPPLRTKDVLVAALASKERIKEALIETQLYVRQIRRLDWERITAATSSVRDFQVPFQCIHALPAIFQKKPGSAQQGQLIASPHLGISSRSDMYFTAVCMPRFRTLPDGICPGFVDETIGQHNSQAPCHHSLY